MVVVNESSSYAGGTVVDVPLCTPPRRASCIFDDDHISMKAPQASARGKRCFGICSCYRLNSVI